MPRVHQCPNCSFASRLDEPASPPGAGTITMVVVIFILTVVNFGMIFYMWRYFEALGNLFG